MELHDDPEESHRPEDEAEENRKLVTSILDKFGQFQKSSKQSSDRKKDEQEDREKDDKANKEDSAKRTKEGKGKEERRNGRLPSARKHSSASSVSSDEKAANDDTQESDDDRSRKVTKSSNLKKAPKAEQEQHQEEAKESSLPQAPSLPFQSKSPEIGHSQPQVLPADFEPTAAHVLCGRRKGHKDFGGNWPGNLALEQVIATKLDEYEAAASNPVVQDEIIAKILHQVRQSGGGFCRGSVLVDDAKKPQQRWMDIGDLNASRDVAAIFKLFITARRSQMYKQQQQFQQQQLRQQLQQDQLQVRPSSVGAAVPKVGPPVVQKPNPTIKRPSATTLANLSLPTKLYAVEQAKQKQSNAGKSNNSDQGDDASSMRKRSAADGEKTRRSPSTVRTINDIEKQRRGSKNHFPPAFGSPGIKAKQHQLPTQFERPKKRVRIYCEVLLLQMY